MIEAQARDGLPRDADQRRAGRREIKGPELVAAIDRDDWRSGWTASLQTMRGGQFGLLASGVHQIGGRKGQVARLVDEADLKRSHHLGAGRGRPQPAAEIAQRRELPLADHSFRHLGDHAKHSGVAAGVVGEGGIGERVIGFLGEAPALEVEQQSLVPGRFAG